MQNIKELYVLEKPIKTKIGLIYPILVDDYYDFIKVNNVLNLDKNALVNRFKEFTNNESAFEPFLQIAQELSLFDFIQFCGTEDYKGSFLHELYKGYVELFKLCFKEDVFHLVENNNEFEEYINIIRDVNGVEYEPTSPNPEIERRNKLRRELEVMKNENITFEDMFISTCVGLQKTPTEVKQMTIRNFYKIFSGIGQFKKYDTSTLFAIVSSDIEIEPWYKISEVKKDEGFLTEEQMQSARESRGLKTKL